MMLAAARRKFFLEAGCRCGTYGKARGRARPAMMRENFPSRTKQSAAAVIVVAANYAYFLVFAQFGFLKILQGDAGLAGDTLKIIMTAMGLAGIAGSLAAARWFSPARW